MVNVEVAQARLVEIDTRYPGLHGRLDVGTVTRAATAAHDAQRRERAGQAIGDRTCSFGQLRFEAPDPVCAKIAF